MRKGLTIHCGSWGLSCCLLSRAGGNRIRVPNFRLLKREKGFLSKGSRAETAPLPCETCLSSSQIRGKEATIAPRPANSRAYDDNFEQKSEKTCRPTEEILATGVPKQIGRDPKRCGSFRSKPCWMSGLICQYRGQNAKSTRENSNEWTAMHE